MSVFILTLSNINFRCCWRNSHWEAAAHLLQGRTRLTSKVPTAVAPSSTWELLPVSKGCPWGSLLPSDLLLADEDQLPS